MAARYVVCAECHGDDGGVGIPIRHKPNCKTPSRRAGLDSAHGSDEPVHESSWLCCRCGRAGFFAHSPRDNDAIVLHIAMGEHTRRHATAKRRNRYGVCASHPDLIRVKRGERDVTILCAEARADGALVP
jgi:hypothetical protein